jgi:hypothetical protein
MSSYRLNPQAQSQRYIPYIRPSSRQTPPATENNNTTHARRASLDQNLVGPFFPSQKSDALIATANSPVELDTRSVPLIPSTLPTLLTLPTLPRASSDFVQSLPTVTEKPIERTDSTISTTAVMVKPQLAQRYRRHPDRHRSLPSLPSELPHLQNQSSLAEDLADWMLTSPQGVDGRSTESDIFPPSPSPSVASCPAATHVPEWNTTASSTSKLSVIARKPLPGTTPGIVVSRAGSVETSNSGQSSIREAESCTDLSQKPNAHDAEMLALQETLLRQTYVAGSEMSSLSKQQPAQGDGAPEPPHTALTAKPLTAQAKRRAAQQRRMQLAFGES